MKLFAVAAPGLEAVVAAEVRALDGVTLGSVVQVPGGVDFEGGAAALWAANTRLRVASKILVRVGTVEARDFAKLRAAVAKLPWRSFAASGRRPRVHVAASAKKCRLYHTGAIAERVEGAIADAFGGGAAEDPDAPSLEVLVRGEHDVFTVSVDASGELLHRRGWRVDTAPASLRETLAAGILALSGWTPDEPLVDPMCGAGTIVIEAALAARGRAPGAARGFAFEAWPGMGPRPAEAPVALPPAPPLLLGNERELATLTLARRNAERAGVAADVTFVHGDARDLRLPATPRPGLIIANPPYGKRLAEAATSPAAALAALWKRSPGWRLAVLLPDDRAALRALSPRPPRVRHPLDNGGLRVFLNVW